MVKNEQRGEKERNKGRARLGKQMTETKVQASTDFCDILMAAFKDI